MHNLKNDGFAILDGDSLHVVFSGSYKKCIEFIAMNKSLVFNFGLVFMSSSTVQQILDAQSFDDSEEDNGSILSTPDISTTANNYFSDIPF